MTDQRQQLYCQCGCGTPFASIHDGCLVIQSVHRGEKHIQVLRLEHVQTLLEQSVDRRGTIGSNDAQS